jgi:hypothetical protein
VAETFICKICNKRRARRYCAAVEGDICSLCCGTHREIAFTCPLECVFLQEAHRHEKLAPQTADSISADLPDEAFLNSHEELFLVCLHALVSGALQAPGTIDADILSALEALIRTYRTLQSGLVYETRAENAVAASIQRSFSDLLEEYRKLKTERDPLSAVHDGAVLKILLFLHWLGTQNQNGRPRGRRYLDILRQGIPAGGIEKSASNIIVVGS